MAVDRRDRITIVPGEEHAPCLIRLPAHDFRIEPIPDTDERRAEPRGIGKSVAPFDEGLSLLAREEPHRYQEADGPSVAREPALVDLEDEQRVAQEVVPFVKEHVAAPRADQRAENAVDDEVARVLFRAACALNLPVEQSVPAEEHADVEQAVVADPVARERHPARVVDDDRIEVPREFRQDAHHCYRVSERGIGPRRVVVVRIKGRVDLTLTTRYPPDDRDQNDPTNPPSPWRRESVQER